MPNISLNSMIIGDISSSNLVGYYDANAITGLSDGDKVDSWESSSEQYLYFDGVDDYIDLGSAITALENIDDYIEIGVRDLTESTTFLLSTADDLQYVNITAGRLRMRVGIDNGNSQFFNTFTTIDINNVSKIRFEVRNSTTMRSIITYQDGTTITDNTMSRSNSPDVSIKPFKVERIMSFDNTTSIDTSKGTLKYIDINGTVYNRENSRGGSATVYGNPKVYNTLYDVENHIYLAGQTDSYSPANGGGVTWADNGNRLYTARSSNTTVYEYTASTPYDFTTLTTGNSFDFSSINALQDSLFDMEISDAGDKMYLLNDNPDRIFEYDLGTNRDVTTASYSGVFFDFSSQDALPVGIAFGDNGSKLYYLGRQFNDVHQYNLSTPRDVSTMTYSGVSLDTSGQTPPSPGAPSGITINSSGDKLLLTMNGPGIDNYIVQYNLATSWDLNTASYDSRNGGELNVNGIDSAPSSISFAGNDETLDVFGGNTDTIYRYVTDRRPTYKTNIQNGLPAVRFDRDFYNTLQLPENINLGQDATYIWVAKWDTNTNGEIISVSNTANGIDIVRSTDGYYIYSKRGPNERRDYEIEKTNIHIASFVRSGADWNFYDSYINKPISLGTAGTFDQDTMFGGVGGAELRFDGDIYELLIYDRVLTDDELYNAITLLQAKRGL